MPDLIKERLLQFIENEKIEKARFERETGLSNGFVDKVGNGIRSKSLDKIIFRYPHLNIDWLLTGRGKMIKNREMRALRIILKEKGISQNVVADALGIDVSALRRYDDLSKRSLSEVLKIQEATGIPMDELTGGMIVDRLFYSEEEESEDKLKSDVAAIPASENSEEYVQIQRNVLNALLKQNEAQQKTNEELIEMIREIRKQMGK